MVCRETLRSDSKIGLSGKATRQHKTKLLRLFFFGLGGLAKTPLPGMQRPIEFGRLKALGLLA